MSGNTLRAEFMMAASVARREDFDALIAGGVPKPWLWAGPMRFGVTPICTYADGTYEPNLDGQPAFIIPASPVPEDTLFEDHDPEDLVAFTLAEPERWWMRLGVCPLLNQRAVERAAWTREPLILWRSPFACLRAMGEGAVILSPDANIRFWLGDVSEIVTQGLELGDEIDHQLTEPFRNLPRIRVLSQIAEKVP